MRPSGPEPDCVQQVRQEIEDTMTHLLRMIDTLLATLPSGEDLRREQAMRMRAEVEAHMRTQLRRLSKEEGGDA